MPLIQKARDYVEGHIAADFHDKRLASLEALKLANILKRKNPYLDEFDHAFGRPHTRFTAEFTREFCHADGSIAWNKLLQINAGNPSPWRIPG